MPVIRIPDHRSIPRLDEPATITGLTVLVSVQCKCEAQTVLGLVNFQVTHCPACGAGFSLDEVSWDAHHPTPRIALSSSPSRAQALLS
jgi:hypothetical protein